MHSQGVLSLRECCGILGNTIGPTPAKDRQLPRSKSEIQQFLKHASRRTDAESWHETQLTKVADLLASKTEFENICQMVGKSMVEACKRTDDLRNWAEHGELPPGVYNERHLLNLALGRTKSAFEALEPMAKAPKLNKRGSATRAIANEYFVQAFKLLLVLVKVAYGEEFNDYFAEWEIELNTLSPSKLARFDTLEPLSESYDRIELGMAHLSLSKVLCPPSETPLRFLPFKDASGRQRPRIIANNLAYGAPYVQNAYYNSKKEEKAELKGNE